MLTHANAAAPIMCACANCDWKGPDTDAEEIRDFWSRVEVGGEVPAGDCPECGAFAYLDRPDLASGARDLVRLLDDVEGLERRLAGVCHVDGCIDAWNQIVETLTGRDPS